nr:hypothetical protein [Tanacetum cinerariifolium]
MARLLFCDYHNMVAILENGEHNTDFHPMVDFIEASHLRYALTVKPTVYVSHLRQFWSTARIETTKEGTKILATVDGIVRTVSRNLKLRDEGGISSLPDAELFENLTLMGYNISLNQKFTFQKGQFSHKWKYLIHSIMQCLSPKSTGFNEFSSNIATALVCLATNRTYNFSKMIFDGLVKNVNNKVSKFLMYPRFLTMCLRMNKFRQITHTQTYVVPFHTKKLFTTLRVNNPSFSGRTVPFFAAMLVHQGEGSGTPTEPHHTPSPEAQTPSHSTHPSSSLPPVTTTSIPTVTSTKTTPIGQYTRRTRIAQSSVPLTIADEPTSPQRDVSQGEACPTDSGFIADQDMATIDKSSTLPHDSAPRVTSSAVVEGSMQQTFPELTALCTSLQRQLSDLTDKFQAQEVEINQLKEREMETVLTSMDAATILASGVVDVPTCSGSVPTTSTLAEGSVLTGNEELPTASPVFATANVVTPVTRRKGKEIKVETKTPKKQKVQEQIDARVARELEEQLEKKDQRRAEQIPKDAEIARIHAEEELQSIIDGLDSSNETVAKYLEEYRQFSSELPMERRIELISDLVKYQENYAKVKDFRGMTFEDVEAKFNSVWKQMEDFIPMGAKEEAERIKRKGINLEQKSAKKHKSSEEITEEAKSPEEVTEEKVKEMMHLVPIEEVYVEALQVKHPIIDWKVHSESQRSYWKITRVHHVAAKDKKIFMLVEKDYPLRKGLALVMICYKLQEPDNSLSMGDEHLDTIPATESNEFIKSNVENLIPIPSESEGIPDHKCDVPFHDNSPPLDEPDNSLSMEDEHLDTVLAMESDELIKSSVENLVPIPSESEGILDNMCDVPSYNNSPPLDVSKDQFQDLSESNEEFSSTDDDSFFLDNIDYVEASPPNFELVSSEVMEIVIPEV